MDIDTRRIGCGAPITQCMPYISDLAISRYPLTATTYILHNVGQVEAVASKLSSSKSFKHFNSRGEIIVRIQQPHQSNSYPFPLVYPSPPLSAVRQNPPPSIVSTPTASSRSTSVSSASSPYGVSPAHIPRPTSSPTPTPPCLYTRFPLKLQPERQRMTTRPILDSTEPSTTSVTSTCATAPPCAIPICSNTIPTTSSPHTRRCPSCIKADWKARKTGIQHFLKIALSNEKNKETEEEPREHLHPEPMAGLAPGGRKRSDSDSSMCSSVQSDGSSGSLVSLSSFTSIKDTNGDGAIRAKLEAAAEVESKGWTSPERPRLTIRIPSPAWRAAKAHRYCADPACSRRLDRWYRRARCVLCRAKGRQRERELIEILRRGVFDFDSCDDDDDDGERSPEGEQQEPVPGARLCAGKWCTHVLPPRVVYKWNSCLVCKNRKRQVAASSDGAGAGGEGEKKEWGGVIFLNAAESASERCASLDCGMVRKVGLGRSPSSLCTQCVRRKAWETARAPRVRANFASTCDKPVIEEPRVLPICQGATPKSDAIPLVDTCHRQFDSWAEEGIRRHPSTTEGTRYPEYLSLLSLSAHFRTQLYAFLRDQAVDALRQKSSSTNSESSSTSTSTATPATPTTTPATPTTTPATPTTTTPNPATPSSPTALFTFTGRFSTVSTVSSTPPPPNPIHIAHVRNELERASHFHFHLQPPNPTEPFVTFEQGFAVRFSCVHSIPLDMFVPEEKELVGWDPGMEEEREELWIRPSFIRKDVKGELDVIVVVDDSHRLLPGQMTVVRFRMGMLDIL
ncbi:hypothetical protein APHAL10511_000420 [Amanita phalloides]|nr:hypothetical protein APHAL10511_000420 [Amanita phalloides]